MAPAEPLRLYDYPASANCFKARLLLAQVGRPYERVPVDIFGGDTLTDEYAEINPARTTPVLQIGPSVYLSESAAILFYLGQDTPLLPTGALERAEIVRWLVIEQTDVMPAVGGLRFRLQTGRWAEDHPEARRRREAGDAILGVLDDHLGDRPFLVGGYSIADIAVYAYTHRAPDAGYDLSRFENVAAWLGRVESQPRFMNDLEPYPPNARPGHGESIYDV